MLDRLRQPIPPAAYRKITMVSLVLLAAIVVTGAGVRLTGSGLGCTDWPRCTDETFTPSSDLHANIEFWNRMITGLVSAAVVAAVLGSLRRAPRRRDLTWLSLGLVAGVLGQIVLGGIVVLTHLNPWLVQGHFVLSMVLVANATVLTHRAGLPDGAEERPIVTPALLRWGWGLVRPGHRRPAHGHARHRLGPPQRQDPRPEGRHPRPGDLGGQGGEAPPHARCTTLPASTAPRCGCSSPPPSGCWCSCAATSPTARSRAGPPC
ncbi:MAG: COX15/CtaA family protein [Acidimicrobiales bacterium]